MRLCSSLSSKDDEVEGYILSSLVVPTTVPIELRKLMLSEAVLVHCTDVSVLLERLRDEKKLELGIVHCGKRFLKCKLILFGYKLYASSPKPSSYILQKGGGRKTNNQNQYGIMS